MNTPKFLTLGASAVALVASGAILALNLQPANPSNTAAAPAAAPAQSRPIADRTGEARRVYDGAKESVVYISSTMPSGEATGSGFLTSSDGRIVTNAHVVDGATQVNVKVGTGGEAQPAQILGIDASHDLALLKVDTGGRTLPALSLADSSKLSVGDDTYAIGNPYGLDHTLTTGIVSALNRDIQAPDGSTITGAIQTDAALNPGNSGGALLDGDGDVVGVNSQIVGSGSSSGQSGNVGIGFAISSNTVAEVIKAIESGEGTTGGGAQSGQAEPQPADPYGGLGTPADPYGDSAPDPTGGYGTDPYGDSTTTDPYGDGSWSDPYGDSGSDQGGGPAADPYSGATAGPY